MHPVFSIVKPQSADWLDGLVVSHPAAGLAGLATGQATWLLVSLARASRGPTHTKKIVGAIAMLESAQIPIISTT